MEERSTFECFFAKNKVLLLIKAETAFSYFDLKQIGDSVLTFGDCDRE
jgi:hypothetical protein